MLVDRRLTFRYLSNHETKGCRGKAGGAGSGIAPCDLSDAREARSRGIHPDSIGRETRCVLADAIVSSQGIAARGTRRCASRRTIPLLPPEFHSNEPADRVSDRKLLRIGGPGLRSAMRASA